MKKKSKRASCEGRNLFSKKKKKTFSGYQKKKDRRGKPKPASTSGTLRTRDSKGKKGTARFLSSGLQKRQRGKT